MRIQELSERTGLSKDTLRYYEKVGVLPAAPKLSNGYRDYPEHWVTILKLILKARALGFNIQELKALSELVRKRQLTPREMGLHLKQKKQDIDRRIGQLQDLKHEIEIALAGHCDLKAELN